MLNRAQGCRLAYVGSDGDVYEAGGQPLPRRLTWGWSDWGGNDRLYYIWPSYSPDGSQVACLGVRTGESPEAALYSVAGDGVLMHEVWRMTEAAPVAESWSPDSRKIALLLQGSDRLQLDVVDVAEPGKTVTLDSGASVFWSWSPQPGYIAVHSGGSYSLYDDARLSVFHVGDRVERVASLRPGEFRTAAWSPDGSRLAYVDASGEGQEFLALWHLGDGRGELVYPIDGQTVISWSPNGETLAIAQALGDSPHCFSDLTLVDIASGNATLLRTGELVSFFWLPSSDGIVSMSFDSGGAMRWTVSDLHGGRRVLDTPFYPSREMVYFCWFFDQFVHSHPPLSPDGSKVVFSGYVAKRKSGDECGSQVYVASLLGDGEVEAIGPGQFACWDVRTREAAA